MEGTKKLDLDFVLDEEDFGLFDVQDSDEVENEEESEEQNTKKTKEKDTTVENEVDPDSLFDSESVGSEEDIEETEEDTSSEEHGTSPNLFSSIAHAMSEEGIFPDLDEDTIKGIKSAQEFREAVEQQMQAGLDDLQKRVLNALNAGLEGNEIRQYEGVLRQLDSIKEEDLTAENEQGEDLRKRLIYQDYINRGFDSKRATREVNKALQNGTDIEDAKEALQSNKDYFKTTYESLINEAQAQKEEEKKRERKAAEKLKEDLLDSNKNFFDLELDSNTRKKAYETISKPVYKDPESGELYTTLQKYQRDHKEEYMAKVGLLYVLTDGFKSLGKVIKNSASKEIKKGFKALESKINNTARDSNGNLKFVSGAGGNEEDASYPGKNVKFAF